MVYYLKVGRYITANCARKVAIENFVALHHACHNMGTDAVHLNPASAIRDGFIVPSWAQPDTTTVTLVDGSSVILTQEGTYRYL